jgi:lysophospholipase L1-like esterase
MVRRARLLLALACLLLLAAGCGTPHGDGGPATVRAGSGRVVATLGDSIVAGSPHWDPDPNVRSGLGGVDRDSQWQRWAKTDDELRNCGVWGERTDQIAARYGRCVQGADGVVIQGGINDIVQGRPIADAAHDIACLAEWARTDGLDVALVEVLPWNNGDAHDAQDIRALNARIHALGRRGGVPVLPFYSVLEDPHHRGRMPQDRTVEGDHPNVAGYRMLGEHAWREPHAATASFADDCPAA